MSPSEGKNDDKVTPSGAAPNHRWRTLGARLAAAARSRVLSDPSSPWRNTLFARCIGGILVIGAVFAWYLLFRSAFSHLMVWYEDASIGGPADGYQAALAGRQPDIRSDFDVYFVGDHLIYVKESCTLADVDAWFFVHVEPVSLDDIAEPRRAHGFDNIIFGFGQHGARIDGTCWMDFRLPKFEVAAIRTGQYVQLSDDSYRNEWTGEIDIQAIEDARMTPAHYQAALADHQPHIRSDFDVYLVEDHMIYVNERCGPEDIDAAFFVHVEPVSPDDLADHRKPHGFDSLVFGFGQHGARLDGTCWANFPLPDYEIAAIRTGQYVEEEGGHRNIWMGEIYLHVRVARITTDDARAALRGRQPDIRSVFDVYLAGNRLIYAKESCTQADVDEQFFVHVEPVSPDDLADHRKPHGFDSLVFGFAQHGARLDGACWADFLLPDYEIAAIRTGQYVQLSDDSYRNEWTGEIDMRTIENARRTADDYQAALAGRQPDIRSVFDVYLAGNRLIYAKESCTQADVDGRFFVQVEPVSADDLSEPRRAHGFDNFVFEFGQYGARLDGACWADFLLPDYEIAAIRTGQYMEAEGGSRNVWMGGIRLHVPVAEYQAALAGRQPDIRSVFDVHLVENRLIYAKESCTRADVDGTFFVHVEPVSADDLSEPRRAHGFDNLVFGFGQYGARLDGACWADFPLPDYEIAAIRTGQYVEVEGGSRSVWMERIRLHVPVAEYQAALADRQPDIRSDFDVYLVENRLIYVREPCTRADVDAWFFVHVEPVSADDLPEPRRAHGFDNLVFEFGQYGAKLDGACWADFPLPDYEIATIWTGQNVEVEDGSRNEWAGEVDMRTIESARMMAGKYQAALAGRRPDIRSDFDVYLVEDHLIYVNELCGPEDIDAGFFVQVEPVSAEDLPEPRRAHGFDNLVFGFGQHGARLDGTCWVDFPLPDYEIASIRTGQYVEVDGGRLNIWQGEIRME